MSVTSVPSWVRLCLWGQAAGRCQYTGCNRPLFHDDVTNCEFNSAYVAHIIADKPDGPRGHPVLSERLKADLSNLMLLCDVHHRLVDIADVDGHPVELLRDMKGCHEERMQLLTGIDEHRQSHVLFYGARIGEHNAPLSYEKAASAIIPLRFPASRQTINLGLGNSSFSDSEQNYWSIEEEHLRRQFAAHVKPRLENEIAHLSVFGLAPIPLLIALGRLLSDIPAADVYQLHREPPDWKWQAGPKQFEYSVSHTGNSSQRTVALVLALSADIVSDRVTNVLGDDVAVWTVTHDVPGNDFLKSREQLQAFRQALRQVFNEIKTTHGEQAELHLFPAVPVSAAIETGRIWMPKADLPFQVYDQNRKTGGFSPALRISSD